MGRAGLVCSPDLVQNWVGSKTLPWHVTDLPWWLSKEEVLPGIWVECGWAQ